MNKGLLEPMGRILALLLFLLLFILGKPIQLAAQEEPELPPPTVERERLAFLSYVLLLPLGEHWQLEQEIEERLRLSPLRQSEFRLRSRLNRKLGESGWTLEGGLLLGWEREAVEPYRAERDLRLEIRPHQQIAYSHSLGERFSFQHTYRFEQRFYQKQNEAGGFGGAGITLERYRLRYQLEVGYKVLDWLQLVASEELVMQMGRTVRPNPFDRNELGLRLELKFSGQLQLDAGYQYRYNPEGIGAVVVHQHIGLLTLIHRLKTARR